MIRIVHVCVGGLFVAVLGACAAPDPENKQSENKPQTASQAGNNENCEEATGSRIKRCAKDSGGAGMVSSGSVPPGTTVTGPAGLSSK